MGWKGKDPYEGQTSIVSLGTTWIDRWAVWLGTGCGLGLIAPFAPGTLGSLPGVGFALLLAMLNLPIWGTIIICAVATLVAVPICTRCERILMKKDDGRITADEWMLYPIALIGIPILEHPWLILVTFVVIRILDILKLPPASTVQYLPEGWGIVADDFISQLFALAVNWGIVYALGYCG